MSPIGEGNKWGKTVSASKRDIQDPRPPRTQEEFYARYDPLHIGLGMYTSLESGLNSQSETRPPTGPQIHAHSRSTGVNTALMLILVFTLLFAQVAVRWSCRHASYMWAWRACNVRRWRSLPPLTSAEHRTWQQTFRYNAGIRIGWNMPGIDDGFSAINWQMHAFTLEPVTSAPSVGGGPAAAVVSGSKRDKKTDNDDSDSNEDGKAHKQEFEVRNISYLPDVVGIGNLMLMKEQEFRERLSTNLLMSPSRKCDTISRTEAVGLHSPFTSMHLLPIDATTDETML